MQENLTPISELGHFALIDKLTENFTPTQPTTVNGIGDDAAVVDVGNNYMLFSSGMLVEGIHFNLVYTPLRHLGYKAVVSAISNIYAMNGNPKQITVSVAVSVRFAIEHLQDLFAGFNLACQTYNIDLVGVNTTSSLSGLLISISAIGQVEKNSITYRKGAEVNDLICVTGNVGAAYMGLQLLERERRIFEAGNNIQPLLEDYSYILERQLKPEACKNTIAWLKEQGIKPTTMIDVTDGVASELLHICKQSNMGCTIYQEKLPIHAETDRMAEELNTTPLIAALNGGDDFELLFTSPISDFEKIAPRPEISIIGHITEQSRGCNLVLDSAQQIELKAQGWK